MVSRPKSSSSESSRANAFTNSRTVTAICASATNLESCDSRNDRSSSSTRGSPQYDGSPAADAGTGDLDHELIEFYKGATGATQPTIRLLENRSLVTTRGEVTNAAVLLFGKSPQRWFPQAYVRVLRFMDDERGTGARLSLEEGSDLRIEGSIPRIVQEASKAIENLIPRRRSLAPDGTFKAVPIVPRDAWLEGLVNAVIHRSYSLSGDHIRVEIYPSRIEIESPGRFPGLADPRTPLEISRFSRNPRIARVCADLRIGQELGEGIKRIFEEMRLRGLSDPIYQQKGGSVRLVLANVPRLDPAVAARLPKGSEKVLDALRAAAAPMGTGDVAAVLSMGRPTAQRRLKALQSAGLIDWVGKSPKDPRAHWIVRDT